MPSPNGMGSIAVPSAPLTADQYQSYAENDPGFLSLKSSLAANEAAYRASLGGGINSGVINLGVAPTDSTVSGYLDPGTAAAAAANPLSTNAGLNTQHALNVRGIQNNLAARGGYDSGELTYGLGNENLRDTQAHADAMSKFMDYANGLFSNLGSMQASDAANLGTQLGAAAMRQLALHPGTTTSAVWDENSGTYVDSQGNHYDQWGNHITSVGGPAPTNFAAPVLPSGSPASGGNDLPGMFGSTPTVVPFSGAGVDLSSLPGASGAPAAPYTPPDQPVITRGGNTAARAY